jgi:hypothetical protein
MNFDRSPLESTLLKCTVWLFEAGVVNTGDLFVRSMNNSKIRKFANKKKK